MQNSILKFTIHLHMNGKFEIIKRKYQKISENIENIRNR